MKVYPQVIQDSLQEHTNVLKQISRLRQEDVQAFTNLTQTYVLGRKVGKIPATSNDVIATDRLGDFNVDSAYAYFLVSSTSGQVATLAITNGGTSGNSALSFVAKPLVTTSGSGSGCLASFDTDVSGTIVTMTAINDGGIDFNIGDTLTYTAFGFLGVIFTVTALSGVTTSAQWRRTAVLPW